MTSRLLAIAILGALALAIAAPVVLLTSAIGDPVVGILTTLILAVTAAPFLTGQRTPRHNG